MNTSIKLYSFGYTELKTYLFALLFAAGNLLLPQLCHFVPNGGHTLLPIFFFTLIAAYKFGIRVGLLTAVLSPVLNHLLFSMPGTEMLPVILVKSGLLAIAGAATAKYAKKISVLALVCIVLAYQLVGTVISGAFITGFSMAFEQFRMGIPGMFIQVIGGYFLLKMISKY